MDLRPVRDTYDSQGPFVTVHLDIGRTAEDGLQQLDARCTNLRHDLERADVAVDLIDDIEARVRETSHRPGHVRRTIIASNDTVTFDETRVGESSAPESVVAGPLPDLAGWTEQAAAEVPFLLVVADREGADLQLHVATRQASEAESQVDGETLHLQKVRQGGLAHAQFQRRSENVWRRNAREVADEIHTLCRAHAPELVVLAGDVRARTEIVEALGHLDAPVEQVESGARNEGASDEALWSDIDDLLARHIDRQTEATLEELGTAHAHGRAVHGLNDVLDALVRAEVDRLVLELGAARSMDVVPARFPGLPLPASASECTDPLPADQVLLAAAAATDATVQLVPGTPEESDGVSAFLRWSREDA